MTCHLVCLEEGVDSLTPRPYHVVQPAWVILERKESARATSLELSLEQLEVLHGLCPLPRPVLRCKASLGAKPDPHQRHGHLVEHLHQHPVLGSLRRVFRMKLDSWEDILDILAGHQGLVDRVAVVEHDGDLAEGVDLPQPFRLDMNKYHGYLPRSSRLVSITPLSLAES